MLGLNFSILWAIGVSLLLSLLLTPAVRRLARRLNLVAKPKQDRWHKAPTAMFGGVAIFVAVIIAALLFLPLNSRLGIVLAASSILFVVGLIDDYWHIKPYKKLVGQILGATIIVYFGLTLPWTPSSTVNTIITIFWLIGITNAINLLDNMDGLASGVSSIAATFLALGCVSNGQYEEATLIGILAAALIGFLVYNSHPATIFMGDCGSMFIGFFLGAAALLHVAGGRTRSFLPTLAVPVLVLLIPIFDTTLVTIARKLVGRSVSQGGRDHSSHRLVVLGLSERRAVWLLYGLSGVSGILSLIIRKLNLDVSLALIALFSLSLTILGIYLARIKVYEAAEYEGGARSKSFSFLIDLSYKRRFFEILLDVILVTLSYYVANLLLFGPFSGDGNWLLFLHTLPILIGANLIVFLLFGVYRGVWRYTGLADLITFIKAVAGGTITSILILLFAFRFNGYSRSLFTIEAGLLLILLCGSRLSFRLLRQLLPVKQRGENAIRVLIYGAGDAGVLLLREIKNNEQMLYAPVGFIDDDLRKSNRVLHGLRVFPGNGSLASVCQKQRVQEVIISSSQFSEERIAEVQRVCQSAGVKLKRMSIKIEPVQTGEER